MRRSIALLSLVSCTRLNPLFLEGDATGDASTDATTGAVPDTTTDTAAVPTTDPTGDPPVPETSSSTTAPTLPTCEPFPPSPYDINLPNIPPALCESTVPISFKVTPAEGVPTIEPCPFPGCQGCFKEPTVAAFLAPWVTEGCLPAFHRGSFDASSNVCRTTGFAVLDPSATHLLGLASREIEAMNFMKPEFTPTVTRGVEAECSCDASQCCVGDAPSTFDLVFELPGNPTTSLGVDDDFAIGWKIGDGTYNIDVIRAHAASPSPAGGPCDEPEEDFVDWVMWRSPEP